MTKSHDLVLREKQGTIECGVIWGAFRSRQLSSLSPAGSGA